MCRSQVRPNSPLSDRSVRARLRCWPSCLRLISRRSSDSAKGLRVESEDLDDGDRSPENLGRLQRHIFSEDVSLAPSAADDQVLVFSAPGEGRECVEITRRVLALAREGVAFDRMAVLLRSPEEYRDHLEEAYARAGVPVHLARGAVRPDPAGRAFCVLLRCAAEGLSAQRFAEYLSLGQVPDATSEGKPPEAAPRGERWVTPDQELLPHRLVETSNKQVAPEATDAPAMVDKPGPVIAGQLRAPRGVLRKMSNHLGYDLFNGCFDWDDNSEPINLPLGYTRENYEAEMARRARIYANWGKTT
jgi:hypothetical protein